MQRSRPRSLLGMSPWQSPWRGAHCPAPIPYSTAIKQNDLVTTTPPGPFALDTLTWNLPYEPLSIGSDALVQLCREHRHREHVRVLAAADARPADHAGARHRVDKPDDRTQVYTLRTDVTFWDGTPMTAKDVAYSLDRQRNPDNGSYFASYYAHVKSVEATGPDQVTVRFTQPDAMFEQAMSTAAGAVSQQAFTERGGENFGTPQTGVMCTGPFEFDEVAARPGSAPRPQRRLLGCDAATPHPTHRLQLHRRRVDRGQRTAQRRGRRTVLLPAARRADPVAEGRQPDAGLRQVTGVLRTRWRQSTGATCRYHGYARRSRR